MRSTFQMLVFLAYLSALVWGGWYVFSGQMMAERDAGGAPVLDEVLPNDAPSEDAAEKEAPPEEDI